MGEVTESVEEYLAQQRSNRPQSFKEITLSVGKSERSVARELQRLKRRGEVNVVTVRFNSRAVQFYTLRKDIDVSAEFPGATFLKR